MWTGSTRHRGWPLIGARAWQFSTRRYARPPLEQAARIAGEEHGRPGLLQRVEFRRQDRGAHLRMVDVVDAGRAAADLGHVHCAKLVASLRDVTERKASEERRELLLGDLRHRLTNFIAVIRALLP